MKGTTVIVFIDPVFSSNPYLHWFALSGGGGGGGGRWREWRDSVNYPGEAASRVHTFLAWVFSESPLEYGEGFYCNLFFVERIYVSLSTGNQHVVSVL